LGAIDSSEYGGYSYHFISEETKELFDLNPSYFIPEWGSFCSWGISGEYLPDYAWDYDCLGPSVDIKAYYLHSDSLDVEIVNFEDLSSYLTNDQEEEIDTSFILLFLFKFSVCMCACVCDRFMMI